MALFNDLKKKYTELLNPVKKSLSDDTGWFQQGKLNIGGGIQQTQQRANQSPIRMAGPLVVPNWKNPTGQDIYKSFGKGLVNTSTFGLIKPKYESQTPAGKFSNIVGNVAGFVNPMGPGSLAMRGLEKIGSKAIAKYAPQLTKTIAGKIVGGVGKEALQTAAYTGGQALSGKLGLAPSVPITPKSVAENMLYGSVLRGAFSPQVAKGVLGTKFSMSKNTMDEVIQAEDKLLHPEKYLEKTISVTKKNANSIRNVQIKRIQEEAAKAIDQISAKHLPNDVLESTAGNVKAQIKALIDLNAENKLANVNYLTDKKVSTPEIGGKFSGVDNSQNTLKIKQQFETEADTLRADIRQAIEKIKTLKPEQQQILNEQYKPKLERLNNLDQAVIDIEGKISINDVRPAEYWSKQLKISPEVKGVIPEGKGIKASQILTKIDQGTNGLPGAELTPQETDILGKYLKTNGDSSLRGKITEGPNGTRDVIFGTIKDRGFKGQTEYLLMADSGPYKGAFRLSSTPIDSKFFGTKIVGDVNPSSPSIPSVKQPIIKIKPSVSPKTEAPKLQQPSKPSSPNISSGNPLVDAITGTKERKFVTTVKESIKTTPEVKNMVSGQYIPKANDTLSRAAKAQIKENIDVARQKALTGLDDESVAIANELIQHYSNLKDFDTAAYIANTTAENLTAHGRAIQAASLYDKLTPEGIQRYAASQLQKVKMQLKPEDAKRLTEMAKKVQDMPVGEGKAMAQQQLMQEIQGLIPTSNFQKLITLWKAGLLTGLKTTGRNITGNTINNVAEIVKDVPATATDMIASLFTGQRSKVFTTKGVISGGKEGIEKGIKLLKTGFDERKQMGKLDVNFVNWGKSKVGQAAKAYTETVFRLLGAQDQPFYYAALRRSLNDQAMTVAKNAGKSGDSAYIAKLVSNPTEQMIKTSVLDAERAVFQNNTALSSAINSAKRAIKGKTELGGAIADFVAPFTGVPSAIASQVINYTPVGLAKTIMENIGKGKFDQRQFVEGIGRGLTGTAIMAIGSNLFNKGLMTLDRPKDQKEQAQWELEGKQAFSVKGIDNKWHSIGSLGPQASVLLQGGYLASGGAGQAVLGGLKQQKEQTFMQGIKNLSDAIDDPTGKASAYAKSTAGSLVPTIIGDVAKGLDPLQRESNSPLQAIQAKTPFLRQGLLPSRNVFGEAKPNEQGLVGSMVDFTNSSIAKSQQPIEELRRLSDENFSATPTKISPDQTIQKMKVKLTPEQLNEFEAKAGPIIRDRINQLIQTSSYQALSDEKKAKAIQDITTTVRTQVKNTMDLRSLSAGAFETSDDAPKNALDTIKVYGEGLFKDPKAVITAVSNGQPIRKIRGDAVVLERAQSLGAIDKGDKTTQVDHVIPLSLGGSNNQDNLQIISTQENQAKAVVEVYLGDLLSKGKINRKEAQDRILNWRSEINNMPSNYKNKANGILSKPVTLSVQKVDENKLQNIGKTYQIVDEKGNVSDIDLSMPEAPKYTGQAELDKLLKSKFSSQLTTLKNNIVKLNLDDQLNAEEANAAIVAINNLKVKSSGGKKPKKVTFKKPKVIKLKAPKIAKIKFKSPKRVKAYKRPKIKKMAIKRVKLKLPKA